MLSLIPHTQIQSRNPREKNVLISSLQYHFCPAGNMIFCWLWNQPRPPCQNSTEETLTRDKKKKRKKTFTHAPTFCSVIWDSCTLTSQDCDAWRQPSSERDKIVQVLRKTQKRLLIKSHWFNSSPPLPPCKFVCLNDSRQLIMFMLQQQSGTFSILYENCVKKKKDVEKYKYVYLYVYACFSCLSSFF